MTIPILTLKSNQIVFYLAVVLLLALAGCSQHEANSGLNSSEIESTETGMVDAGVTVEAEDALVEEEEAEVLGGEDDLDEFDEFDEFEDEFGDVTENEVSDPLEGYNRAMTTFNDKLYFWVLKPVATGYRWLVPEVMRNGIANFFHNLLYPVRFVNNLLQLKFKNAGEETIRFVYNTTFGFFGFWNAGKDIVGLDPHEEDFGQTLGFYGVGGGPHIVLPILGPSNLRDAFSLYPDTVYLDPKSYYIEGTERQVGVFAFEKVNEASLRIGEYESLKKDAIDFYIFMRDGYEQMRIKEIEE